MYVTYFCTVWNNERVDLCTGSEVNFSDAEVLAWEVPTEAIAILELL